MGVIFSQDQGEKLFPIEVKSGQTVTKDYFKNITRFLDIAGNTAEHSALIYGCAKGQGREKTDVIGWQDIEAISKTSQKG